MKAGDIGQEVRRLGAVPGVLSCALVDAATGMVLHSVANDPGAEPLVEAARDYWQLHARNGRLFSSLGAVCGIVVAHEHGAINLLPCGRGMVLVTLAERGRIDFSTWPIRIALLRGLVQQEFANPDAF